LLLILLVLGLGFGVSAQPSPRVKALASWVKDTTYFYQIWAIGHMATDEGLIQYLDLMVKAGWEITMHPLPMSPELNYPNGSQILVTFRKR